MNDTDVEVELELTVGEDASWQMFWTDEYGAAVPISDPVLADVKDANDQLIMRFSTTNDPLSAPAIQVGGPNGFIQLTAPSTVTRQLIAGRYRFDLFASVADSATFPHQLRKVLGGWVVAGSRTTRIEDASEAILSAIPGGS